ncbi:MAG: tRNA epoxyqueuosine(34) reductase QueG [Patescibacteria group bacterium]
MNIEGKILELGFDLFGIASPEVPGSEIVFFEKWISKGYAANMEGWLARGKEKRADLSKILPGVKSVIVVGMNYYPGDHRGDKNLVARYAWGDDYHEVMGEKLEELSREIPGESKWYTDTGSILERYFAVKAGLGFIGKNTCLITPEFGSWVFLGIVLTTVELEPTTSKPMGNCGDCRKCIDACPTGALSEKKIDCRKCISYLTIEKKGNFNPEEKGMVAGQKFVFGCDRCQEVCPHNCRAKKTDVFNPRMQDLDIEDFKIPQKSPLRRAKKEGLVRNLSAGHRA